MPEQRHTFGCETPGERHHRRCPRTYVGQNGVTYVCDCTCHQEEGMN